MQNKPDLMIAVGDDAGANKTAGSESEQCVPLDALSMPDEGEQMVTPEVGDPVSYTVEGKVTRLAGQMAYVEPQTINGKPVEKPAEEAGPDEPTQDDQQLSDLQDQAQQTGYMS